MIKKTHKMYIPDKVKKIYKLPVEVRSAKTRLKHH